MLKKSPFLKYVFLNSSLPTRARIFAVCVKDVRKRWGNLMSDSSAKKNGQWCPQNGQFEKINDVCLLLCPVIRFFVSWGYDESPYDSNLFFLKLRFLRYVNFFLDLIKRVILTNWIRSFVPPSRRFLYISGQVYRVWGCDSCIEFCTF